MFPIQPIERDSQGTVRFRVNKIVRFLLDNGEFDLNDLARRDFPDEDWEQFAQLIGYSVSGFGDLSYARQETVEAVDRMVGGLTEEQARLAHLREALRSIREGLKGPIAQLYGLAPEDLNDDP